MGRPPVVASAAAALVLLACGCTFARVLWYNASGIEDHRIFEARRLRPGDVPRPFARDPAPRALETFRFGSRGPGLARILADNDTVSCVIVRRGRLVYEAYFRGYDPGRLSLAFSVTKSIQSLLVGCAVADGLIASVRDPVSAYLPELAPHGFDRITLRHLLQMTSGLDYAESDNPFGVHAAAYYTRDVEPLVIAQRPERPPGTRFAYKSGDAMLLTAILRRALRGETLTAYAQRKLWTPLGMEFGGAWVLDSAEKGVEKGWCGIASPARDLAKVGQLMLNGGEWRGRQVVPREWIEACMTRHGEPGDSREYHYQWWSPHEDRDDVMASGHLGQYVYVSPANDVVIVRLGRSLGAFRRTEWPRLLAALADALGERGQRHAH